MEDMIDNMGNISSIYHRY